MNPDDAIVTQGNLSYYCAQSTVVSIRTSLAEVKLCRIQFGSDGSIYVPFPYLKLKRGILSEVVDLPPPEGPFKLELAKNGVAVDYDVKFSHHASGVVRFSRTGADDVWPRRKSFPLSTEIGKVFQLQVDRLSGLDWVTKIQAKELPLVFSFPDQHPMGVILIAGWRRKDDIMSSGRPIGVMVGPRSDGIHRKTGAVNRWAFLGQPPASPLQDHVLMLAVEAAPAIDSCTTPTMVFFGGFDPHEEKPGRIVKRSKGLLAFMYPFTGDTSGKAGKQTVAFGARRLSPRR